MGKQDSQLAADSQYGEPAVNLDEVVAATQSSLESRADLVQMKMENETIMAECRVRPRNMAEIKRELASMLEIFPELALQARYCKPCGKDTDGKEKEARGLSVRAAEVLAEAYRYNRVRVDVTPLSDGLAKVDATFTDFQNCRIWQDAGVVSQVYKKNPRYAKFAGEMARIPDDRFWNVTCKAEASKRVREVILRSVNAALKRWFENECVKVASKLLDPDAIEKIQTYFRELGVGLEKLEKFIGREKKLGWTVDDRLRMLELKNAIEEGEITIAMAFDGEESEGGRRPLPTASGRSSEPRGKTNGEAEAEQTVAAKFHTVLLESLAMAEDAGLEDGDKIKQVQRKRAQWQADHSKDKAAVDAIQAVAAKVLEGLVAND